MKRWALIFLLGLPVWVHAEGSLQMRMEVSPRDVYIGDLITARIVVTYAPDLALIQDTAPVTMGNFEVRSWSPGPSSETADHRLSQTTEFQLATFSTGTQTLPALTLHFAAKDGSLSEAKSDEVSIQVKSLLQEKGDEGRLRPLKGVFNIRSWMWAWILLAVVIVGGLGIWIWNKRAKNSGAKMAPVDPRKPEEIAWESIQALEDENLVAQGKTKDFYIRLSDIIRAYLEGRYSISALEKTTSELFSDLRVLNFESDLNTTLRLFFETGDLVKFAKYTPDEGDIQADLLRAKEFITKTTPVVESSEPQKKSDEQGINI